MSYTIGGVPNNKRSRNQPVSIPFDTTDAIGQSKIGLWKDGEVGELLEIVIGLNVESSSHDWVVDSGIPLGSGYYFKLEDEFQTLSAESPRFEVLGAVSLTVEGGGVAVPQGATREVSFYTGGYEGLSVDLATWPGEDQLDVVVGATEIDTELVSNYQFNLIETGNDYVLRLVDEQANVIFTGTPFSAGEAEEPPPDTSGEEQLPERQSTSSFDIDSMSMEGL